MKTTKKSQGNKQFIIKCIPSNGRYIFDYRIYGLISEKLVLGYEVILQPIPNPNVLQGKMCNIIIIEESL